MTVLNIGGAGLIGKPVCERLAASGTDVVCMDVDTDVDFEADVATTAGDVTDYDSVAGAIAEYDPDTVLDFAYIVGGDANADFSTSVEVNVRGIDNVFRAAAEGGVDRVVWASTVGVYGVESFYEEGETLAEEAVPPAAFSQYPDTSYYASMKQFNEYQARLYADEHEMDVVSVRPSTLFGARRQSGFPWLSNIVENAVAGEETHIPFTPETELNFIYVDDVADLFATLAEADALEHDVYNTGGHTLSFGDLAALVEETVGGTVTCDPDGGTIGLPARFSNERARTEFDFELTSIEAALSDYAEQVS